MRSGQRPTNSGERMERKPARTIMSARYVVSFSVSPASNSACVRPFRGTAKPGTPWFFARSRA